MPPDKKAGAPTGVHTMVPRDTLHRAGQGMQFLGIASDLFMMNAVAQEYVKVLCPEEAGHDLARY